MKGIMKKPFLLLQLLQLRPKDAKALIISVKNEKTSVPLGILKILFIERFRK